jgi:hypothetical protein
MTVSTQAGTHEVEVPRFLRQVACLDEAQVVEIARLAQALETTMGRLVDMECAFAGGALPRTAGAGRAFSAKPD